MRPLLFALLVTVASLALGGCSSMEPRGSIAHPQVDQRVAVAFAAARTSLALTDAAEAAWLDSLARPTDEQLAQSSARIAKLQSVRDVLERVRQHLSGDVSADLSQALSDLRLLVTNSQKLGVKVPAEAVSVLDSANEVLP